LLDDEEESVVKVDEKEAAATADAAASEEDSDDPLPFDGNCREMLAEDMPSMEAPREKSKMVDWHASWDIFRAELLQGLIQWSLRTLQEPVLRLVRRDQHHLFLVSVRRAGDLAFWHLLLPLLRAYRPGLAAQLPVSARELRRVGVDASAGYPPGSGWRACEHRGWKRMKNEIRAMCSVYQLPLDFTRLEYGKVIYAHNRNEINTKFEMDDGHLRLRMNFSQSKDNQWEHCVCLLPSPVPLERLQMLLPAAPRRSARHKTC
jgi:hypothetical protein